MLEHKILVVGQLGTNCHLLWNPTTNAGVIVDPGDEADYIATEIKKAGFTPQAILLTHAHVDHIGGVPALATQYHIPVWMHNADRGLYLSPDNCLPPWIPAVQNLPLPAEALPHIDGVDFTVIHTPGHTPGGVCYHFANDGFILSGETLFCGSIGRTDFPGGNYDTLIRSIREKLLLLPGETIVYPGHGERTSIAIEKFSPYFE